MPSFYSVCVAAIVFSVEFALAGCAPSSSRGRQSVPDSGQVVADDAGVSADLTASGTSFSDTCSGGITTLTGTVFAPNGMDPIANALVYVPSTQGAFPAGVQCELCDAPVDAAAVTATSKADGTFSLDISLLPFAAEVPFTVNKGRFRRNTMVSIIPCSANAIGAPHTVLPGKTGTGDDIPKIAVSTGNKDQLDAVLAAMGLDSTLGFDCFEGRKSSTTKLSSPCGSRASLSAIETLLADETTLETYNIVFLSCAPGKFASLPVATQTTIAANLKTWTGKGGRLFVTDNSYDYIAQAFPTDVGFLNGTAVDAANVGVGGSSSTPTQYSGKINDATLQAWLATIGAIPASTSTLTLSGYLNNWSVIATVPTTTVDEVDATDAVAYTTPGGTTKGAAATYPQSIKFDITPAGGSNACGRAIYTSYHTLPTTMMVNAMNLAPQERILEYLMFEAGACVGPIP